MTQEKIRIVNGKVITPHGIIDHGTVLIIDGIIAALDDQYAKENDTIEIDAEGKYISPGFIDIHVHGGGGYDFMDATETAFLKIAETHAQYGTTAMLPTTLTSTKQEILRTLEVYEKANQKNI